MTDETPSPAAPVAPRYSRTRIEQDFLAAFEAIGTEGFFEFMAEHYHPDGVLTCNCPSELLQLGGTHHGFQNIVQALRSFFVEFGVTVTSVDDIVIDGAHVVVNYNMSLCHVGTGQKGRIFGLNHYVLGLDRKIAKTNIFLDNAALAVVGDMLDKFAATTRGMRTARRRRSVENDD